MSAVSTSLELAYFSKQLLQGFSTNILKRDPNGSSDAVAGSIVRFTLPQNTIVNFRSLALHLDAEITSASAYGRLPNGISGLIQRIELEIGGRLISAGTNYYNILANIKGVFEGKKPCPVYGHPDVVRLASSSSSYVSSSSAKLETKGSYVIDQWEGFFDSCNPSHIDTSLLGTINVIFHFADNNVCCDCSGTSFAGTSDTGFDVYPTSPAPKYKCSNIYMTMEVCGLNNGIYDNLISNQLASTGKLEINFKEYTHFNETTSSSMPFSVASQSIDKIWIVHHQASYLNANPATKVLGHIVYDATNGSNNPYNSVGNYNSEKYVSNFFWFKSQNGNASTHQLQLNSSLYPQWQASPKDMVYITKNSLETEGKYLDFGLNTYLENYCVFCCRLNLKNSELSQIISGLNSKGVSLNGYYKVTNGAFRPVSIFVETTSTLEVFAGQLVNLVL